MPRLRTATLTPAADRAGLRRPRLRGVAVLVGDGLGPVVVRTGVLIGTLVRATRCPGMEQHRRCGNQSQPREGEQEGRLADPVVQDGAQPRRGEPDDTEHQARPPVDASGAGAGEDAGRRGDADDDHARGGRVLGRLAQEVDQRGHREDPAAATEAADDGAHDEPEESGQSKHQITTRRRSCPSPGR